MVIKSRSKTNWKRKSKWQQSSTAGSTSGGDGESASDGNEKSKLNVDFLKKKINQETIETNGKEIGFIGEKFKYHERHWNRWHRDYICCL